MMAIKEVFGDPEKAVKIWRVDKMITFSIRIFRHSDALKLRTTEFLNLISSFFLEQKEYTKLQTVPTKSREQLGPS